MPRLMPSAAPVTPPTIPFTAAPPTAPAAAVVASAARFTVLPTLRTAPPTTLMMTPWLGSLSLRTPLETLRIPVERQVNSNKRNYSRYLFERKACHVADAYTTSSCRQFPPLCRDRCDSVAPPINQHGCVITGRLAFALLADDLRIGHAAGQRRRSEYEVDAHALPLRKPQLGVVPVGVDAGAWRERPYHVGELRVDNGVERPAFRFGDMRGSLEKFGVPNIVIGGGDIPVTDQRDLRCGIVAQPAGRRITQRGKPIQLVGVVRITQGAAVGHVQAPHPNAAAGRAQGAGFGRGGHLGFATPAGLAVEADLHIVQTNARGDGHTVPLIETDVRDLA